MLMRPVLKYKGGKSRELPQFAEFIPRDFDRYCEPFFGGGSVYFYLEPQRALLGDINARLIGFYIDLRDNFKRLYAELSELSREFEHNQIVFEHEKAQHPDEHILHENESLYYAIRDEFNHLTGKYLPGTVYYFINKTAYSGMTRYNQSGAFNVSFGRYKHLNLSCLTEQHSLLLNHSELYCCSYEQLLNRLTPRDFVFLDPPYDCLFHDYGNPDNFDEQAHRELAGAFHNLPCRALMIIGETDLTRFLYQSDIVGAYDKQYAANIRNRFRYDSRHLIVMNYHI